MYKRQLSGPEDLRSLRLTHRILFVVIDVDVIITSTIDIDVFIA